MNQPNLSELTDEELLQEAKKMKQSRITHAFIIGFLIGILIFGAAVNTWGFTMLIPLYLIYLFTRNPNDNKELMQILKERGLT
jgi:fatty acid desaturase